MIGNFRRFLVLTKETIGLGSNVTHFAECTFGTSSCSIVFRRDQNCTSHVRKNSWQLAVPLSNQWRECKDIWWLIQLLGGMQLQSYTNIWNKEPSFGVLNLGGKKSRTSCWQWSEVARIQRWGQFPQGKEWPPEVCQKHQGGLGVYRQGIICLAVELMSLTLSQRCCIRWLGSNNKTMVRNMSHGAQRESNTCPG